MSAQFIPRRYLLPIVRLASFDHKIQARALRPLTLTIK